MSNSFAGMDVHIEVRSIAEAEKRGINTNE